MSFTGKIEIKPHGDNGDAGSVFLGQDLPLCVLVRKGLGGVKTASVTIAVEGATVKTASGIIEVEYQLIASGAFSPLKKYESLSVGGKDILAYLKKAEGRRAKLSITF